VVSLLRFTLVSFVRFRVVTLLRFNLVNIKRFNLVSFTVLSSKPKIINIDKSGANTAAIRTVNRRALSVKKIKIRRVKYLNNIVEQDHRTIKRRISITTGFKEFESAQRTLAGIEVINIIRKDQIKDSKSNSFATFKSLAA